MIVFGRDPRVLWLGALGVACAFFYHAPPLRLAYRGWGELAVALCYGPLIAAGTFLVQRGTVDPRLALLSVPLGLLIGAFLLINEFPDYRADAGAGKRTLVVRLGQRRASRIFTAAVVTAFAIVLVAPAAGLPVAVWLGLIGLPFGWAASRRLGAHPTTTRRIVPAQAWTLSSFVAMSVGCALGLFLG
jgi:1,4-dihydroxy-2-naphthoate octaprenyltransferase